MIPDEKKTEKQAKNRREAPGRRKEERKTCISWKQKES